MNSFLASSGSTSRPQMGRSVPSTGTGFPPLTSCGRAVGTGDSRSAVRGCAHPRCCSLENSVRWALRQAVLSAGYLRLLTCASESLRECAGSVDTTRTVCPSDASLTARLADRLVFPTPPFPLIMMYLRWVPAARSWKAEVVGSAVTAKTGCCLAFATTVGLP